MPEISIIMGVHNAGRFLASAVQSILEQTFADWELLLVDNGSTDGALEALLANLRDSRIRVLRFVHAIGVGQVHVEACAVASGRYLAVLDQDDLALPRRLEVQRQFLEQNPDIFLIGSVAEIINADGVPQQYEPCIAWHDDIYARTAYVHVLRHSSVMFRRELLERVVYRDGLGAATDFDFFARAAEVSRLASLPVKLCQYRLHGGNMSLAHKSTTAISGALVRMLTRRRRLGLTEDYPVWNARFRELERFALCSEFGAHLGCARIFRQEGYEDLAALHAWLAWRAGGGIRAVWAYSWAVLRGFTHAEGLSWKLARAWLKEPAHQLLIAKGLPDRMQF